MAMAMSDEDEDGELYYNKIPDYIKEKELDHHAPQRKGLLQIPLPYGFSMFANLGSTAVEVAYGHKQIDTAMMQLSSSFMNSFSPISFGQSKDLYTKAGKSLVPTVFKPLADVMTNETYFGGPVYSENLPFGVQKPESSMSFRSPESVQQFFRWMNEATGGSVEVKGDLDFNPDKMWYMFEYFIGGAGKFVTRSGQAARKLAAMRGQRPSHRSQRHPVRTNPVRRAIQVHGQRLREERQRSSPCTRKLETTHEETSLRDTRVWPS